MKEMTGNTGMILETYGVTPSEAAKRGMSYLTVWFHLRGRRNVSPEQAMLYHKHFGVPLEQLRPDLWTPPADEQGKDKK